MKPSIKALTCQVVLVSLTPIVINVLLCVVAKSITHYWPFQASKSHTSLQQLNASYESSFLNIEQLQQQQSYYNSYFDLIIGLKDLTNKIYNSYLCFMFTMLLLHFAYLALEFIFCRVFVNRQCK